MGSLYCSWLSSTRQSTSCSTICQKRLQADHISFRTYLPVSMLVTRRTQEKCSSVPVLQGSTWTGSCPRAWTSTYYKMHQIRWNWYIYCYVIPHWFLQVFISPKDSDRLECSSYLHQSQAIYWFFQESPPQVPRYSCWPLLSRATPAVTGDHPLLDIHWRTLNINAHF